MCSLVGLVCELRNRGVRLRIGRALMSKVGLAMLMLRALDVYVMGLFESVDQFVLVSERQSKCIPFVGAAHPLSVARR